METDCLRHCKETKIGYLGKALRRILAATLQSALMQYPRLHR